MPSISQILAMENIPHIDADQVDVHAYRELRIADNTLDDAELEAHCPLDNGRHHVQPRHSAGQLDLLPMEIITQILLALDLPTLTSLRCVNKRSMSLVDSLYEYEMVVKHCPNILRAIISLESRSFNCRALYKTLRTAKCESCSRFGGYLYLITCKRVCYFCFTTNLKFLPVSTAHVVKHTGLSRRELGHIPHISGLPGRYTANAKLSKKRIMLFDRHTVLNTSPKTPVQIFGGLTPQDRTTREPRRYMSIISAPYFGSSSRDADWGFYCARCRDNTDPKMHFRTKFSTDGLINHIKQHTA